MLRKEYPWNFLYLNQMIIVVWILYELDVLNCQNKQPCTLSYPLLRDYLCLQLEYYHYCILHSYCYYYRCCWNTDFSGHLLSISIELSIPNTYKFLAGIAFCRKIGLAHAKIINKIRTEDFRKKDGTKIKMIIQNVYDAQYIQNQGWNFWVKWRRGWVIMFYHW